MVQKCPDRKFYSLTVEHCTDFFFSFLTVNRHSGQPNYPIREWGGCSEGSGWD